MLIISMKFVGTTYSTTYKMVGKKKDRELINIQQTNLESNMDNDNEGLNDAAQLNSTPEEIEETNVKVSNMSNEFDEIHHLSKNVSIEETSNSDKQISEEEKSNPLDELTANSKKMNANEKLKSSCKENNVNCVESKKCEKEEEGEKEEVVASKDQTNEEDDAQSKITESWKFEPGDPLPETEYYRWDPINYEWVPKISNLDYCNEVDEDGHRIYRDADGTVFFYDVEKKAWFPKVDTDMLLQYQSNYVFHEDTPSTSNKELEHVNGAGGTTNDPVKSKESVVSDSGSQETNSSNKRAETSSWFDIDPGHNTKVYVSNLPLDIDLKEFGELMGKYGLIRRDGNSNELKLKLYKQANGEIKGDGICDYVMMESVQLALSILDESTYRGNTISVSPAKFQLRGEYNPKLKPKRRKKDKEKEKKMNEKMLDWRPERMRGERAKYERIVIIKNYFTPEIFENDVQLVLEYQCKLRDECSKIGHVNKVILYDRHAEGVAQVNMTSAEDADKVIEMMHGRLFGQRKLTAANWDGKTAYKIKETKAEEQTRLSSWEKYLETTEDCPETSNAAESALKPTEETPNLECRE